MILRSDMGDVGVMFVGRMQSGTGLEVRQYKLAFFVLALPFFLNDFAYIALNGTDAIYLADYATRLLVVLICFLWPVSRAIAWEADQTRYRWYLALLVAIIVPIVGRSLYTFLEVPFKDYTGLGGLFAFHRISDQGFYLFDLTIGLFAVAFTEELVFRKFALKWLESIGLGGASNYIVVSLVLLIDALGQWTGTPDLHICRRYGLYDGLYAFASALAVGSGAFSGRCFGLQYLVALVELMGGPDKEIMALNRKNSRQIQVNGRAYRWTVFENSGWLDVTVQLAEGTGQKLVVQTGDFSGATPEIDPGVAITPANVRDYILKAITLGWMPTASGPPFLTRWDDKQNLLGVVR